MNKSEIESRKPKYKRIFRWLRWFAVFVVVYVTVVPTLQAIWIRHRVLTAIHSAQSVRLEGFDRFSKPPKIITIELNSEQRKEIATALPIIPDAGIPGLYTLCFMPHHRLIAHYADGKDFTFLICFTCNEIKIDDGMIFEMPFLWQSSLRNLFTQNKIPLQVENF